jgi:hypothetical protein
MQKIQRTHVQHGPQIRAPYPSLFSTPLILEGIFKLPSKFLRGTITDATVSDVERPKDALCGDAGAFTGVARVGTVESMFSPGFGAFISGSNSDSMPLESMTGAE